MQAYIWPEQQKPSSGYFYNWHIALEEVYEISTTNTVFPRHLHGRQRNHDIRNFLQWHLDEMTNTLWEPDEIAGWVKWITQPGRTRMDKRRYIRTNITSHQRPEISKVVTVLVVPTSVQLLSKGTV